MNTRGTFEHSVTVGLPKAPRFALLSKHGRVHGTYSSATRAAEVAKTAWPGMEQDCDRAGKGWDIEVVT